MRTIQINVPDNQHKVVSDLLKTIPSIEVTDDNVRSIIPSNAQPGEKPSDYAGPWKKDKRDFQEIRRKSWTRKR
ncbi:hypothetical protein [Larkinella terrae]|uniref:Uncharacterized protein n=1 Tax=Larkinella terrae TaxID=2025311 RepID=A0A7K0ENH8_9BACT|nr:hypothetical protein [Larkinella terrae]MRS63046.1 hypothetical protein [Larkinella terrae]